MRPVPIFPESQVRPVPIFPEVINEQKPQAEIMNFGREMTNLGQM